MLKQGNYADPTEFAQLLGRSPQAAIARHDEAQSLRRDALLSWLLPLLRLSLALVWFATAAVSLWGWPRQDSYALLAAAGIPTALQALLFYGAVAMDAALGIACLLNTGWRVQLGLVLFYSIIIGIKMPEFLWHPFGPLLKNLPILALIFMLAQFKNVQK